MSLKFKKSCIYIFISIAITILLAVLCYVRIKLTENIPIDFDNLSYELFDSGYYINNALDFSKMTAKTDYGLIKNRGYLWLLLLSHYIGTPPFGLATIFWIISALIGYIVSRRITKTYSVAILVFFYILFHPIAFFSVGKVNFMYRNIMYVQFCFLYIELLLLLFYEISKNVDNILNYILGIVLAVVFFTNYLLSETGALHIMIFLGFSFLFTCYNIYKNFSHKIMYKLFKRLGLTFLPFILFLIFLVGYKIVNYRAYGVYTINFRTEGEVKKFISNVQDIESDKQGKVYWCTLDQMEKAYEVSDTLKNNEKFYNGITNAFVSGFIKDEGYMGDFFGWGITQTLKELGIEYDDANEMLIQINQELENAFKYGLLKKTKKFKLTKTTGRYSENDINEILEIQGSIIDELFTLKFLSELIMPYEEYIDTKKRNIAFFNINTNTQNSDNTEYIKNIVTSYQSFNYYLYIFSISIAILVIVFNIISFYKYKFNFYNIFNIVTDYNIYFIISICFILFYVLYCFAISFFVIWFGKFYVHLYYYYAAIGITFLFLSYVFMIFSFISLIKKIAKICHVKEKLTIIIFEFIFGTIILFYPLNFIREYFDMFTIREQQKFNLVNQKITSDTIGNEYLDYSEIDDLFKENEKQAKSLSFKFTYSDLVNNISIVEYSNNKYLEKYFANNFKYINQNNYKNIEDAENDILNFKNIIILRIDRKNIIEKMTLVEFKDYLEKIFSKALSANKMIYILPIGQNIDCIKQNFKEDDVDRFYNYIIKKHSSVYNNVIYVDIETIYKKYISLKDITTYSNYNTEVITYILDKISKTIDVN